MAKFKLKTKDSGRELIKIAIIAAAMLGSRKFLSFESFFKNMKPDSMWIKNEGLIKVGLAAILIPMVRNEYLKAALLGIGLEGGVKAIRRFTMKNGQFTMDAIGNQNQQQAYYMQEYNKMMGQFPGYGYTPGQVQQQMQYSVAGQPGGVAPYSGVPYSVGKVA